MSIFAGGKPELHMKVSNNFFNYTALSVGLGLISFAAAGCSEKHDEDPGTVEILEPGSSDKITPVMITEPAALLGTASGAESVMARFTNIVSPDAAKVIVVPGSELSTYSETVMFAYRKGALIVVTAPDESEVAAWCEANKIAYAGFIDPDATDQYQVYSFNNRGSFYFLEKQKPQNDILDDEDVPLNSFSVWINTTAGSRRFNGNANSPVINQRFTPQSVTHTFCVSLDKAAVDAWNDTDMPLSTTTTVDVAYTIYPVHVFETGTDRYYIEATATVNNPAMYNGEWARVRESSWQTVFSRSCGFYMKSANFQADLLKGKGYTRPTASADHVFPDGTTPVPDTTIGSDTYQSGFASEFSGTITGGIDDGKNTLPLAAQGNWRWSNLKERECSGFSIWRVDNASNGVRYLCNVSGLPDNNSLDVPALAIEPLTFHYSWVWEVSANETDENFYLSVNTAPVYQAYRLNQAGEASLYEFPANTNSPFCFRLIAPSRIPTGAITMTNSSETFPYVGDITLWREPAGNTPDFSLDSPLTSAAAIDGAGVRVNRIVVPAGEYRIDAVRYRIDADQTHTDITPVTSNGPVNVIIASSTDIDFGSDLFIAK